MKRWYSVGLQTVHEHGTTYLVLTSPNWMTLRLIGSAQNHAVMTPPTYFVFAKKRGVE